MTNTDMKHNTKNDDGPVLQDNARKTGFDGAVKVITDQGPMKISDVVDMIGETPIKVLAYHEHAIELERAIEDSWDKRTGKAIPPVYSNFVMLEPYLGRELIVHKSKTVVFKADQTPIKAGTTQKYVYTGQQNLTGNALTSGTLLIDRANFHATINDPVPDTGIKVEDVSYDTGLSGSDKLYDLKFDGADGYVLDCGVIALHENYYVDALDEVNLRNHTKKS